MAEVHKAEREWQADGQSEKKSDGRGSGAADPLLTYPPKPLLQVILASNNDRMHFARKGTINRGVISSYHVNFGDAGKRLIFF